ncbi:unnamed protein product, partial [marine sediment metagenome]
DSREDAMYAAYRRGYIPWRYISELKTTVEYL